MPRNAAAHRIAALSVAAIALFGLTACTDAPATPTSTSTSTGSGTGSSQSSDQTGDAGQSKEDACVLLQQSIEEATEDFETASSSTDPAAAIAAMTAASEKLAEASAVVTNDEVAALLPALQDTFGEAFAIMEAIVQGDVSKIDDLTTLGTKFQEVTESFQAVCGS